MSRNLVDRPFVVGRNYIEAAGLSTDVKPTGTIITGSLFFETDTGKMYVYNETNESWTQFARGGGGGGSLPIHICVEGEYDPQTSKPTVTNPDENVFYLVPTGDTTGDDQFKAWVYSEGRWESWESMSVEIPQSDWNQTNTAATDYIKNKPAIKAGTGTSSILEASASAASEPNSHAEGGGTTASGAQSHAEGGGTTASGAYSHAEGVGTQASGAKSHAEGFQTIANHASQHVFGEFNIADSSAAAATERGNYVEIVGNGTINARSNVRTLDWSGNEWLAGNLTAAGGSITIGSTTITEVQLQALLALLN